MNDDPEAHRGPAQTGRLRIRLARPGDASAICDLYRPIVADTAISFELEPPDESEIRRRMAPERSILFLVGALDADFAGYAYATPFRPRPAYRFTVETTVYVHPDHQRRGVGGALYRSLLACLRLLGYTRAVAGITVPNPASVALHRAAGFERAARLERVGYKLGAWHDVEWWTLVLAEAVEPPEEPRGVGEVVGTREWVEALRGGKRV